MAYQRRNNATMPEPIRPIFIATRGSALALAQARAVLATPVIEHIGGHAMALFELAALHLEREAATGGKEKPDLAETALAIDAMAALVEGLGDRLEPYRTQLEQALNQLRMAFVQLS